jgi:GNAT superfamily N-acetyltransferase
MAYSFEPLTEVRWDALTNLFGNKGACGGCWCMTWRLTSAEYEKQKGERNKIAFQRIVQLGKPAGVLAFHKNQAVGWCAIAPRTEFKKLENSKILKRIDNAEVWSITCFFIKKGYRNQGLSRRLINAAVNYAKQNGAEIVEGYPVEPKKYPIPEIFAFTGLAAAFNKAGFIEVARNSETRPIMRKYLLRKPYSYIKTKNR